VKVKFEIEHADDKPAEPFVRINLPLFIAVCAVSGMMIGTGLGRGATLNPLWYLLAVAGLAVNVSGFILKTMTNRVESWETVEEIIKELRLDQDSADALRRVNGTKE